MPVEVCADCSGVGWKIIERDGQEGAVRCECQILERAANLETKATLPPLYRNASFDSFQLPQENSLARRDLSQVLHAVRSFSREFPAGRKSGLLLMVDPGTGKTHLAVAAFRAIMEKGFEGLFFDYQNLLDTIRSGYDKASGASDREAYRTVMEAEVLLLDDLGSHRANDWVEDTVTSIITYRCNNRKPLIATTNLIDPEAGYVSYEKSAASPGSISQKIDYRTTLSDRIGPRARSRLFEMCHVIKMPLVEDYRIRKQTSL